MGKNNQKRSANTPEPTSAEIHQSKKQKTKEIKLGFPRFHDGDTVISLGAEKHQDLLLHRVELRRMSGYFAAFSDTEWPEQFELIEGEGDSQLKPATGNSRAAQQPKSNVDFGLSSRIHELFFRILYHQPFSFLDLNIAPEQVLLKLTNLAKIYDCLNYVKDQLTAEIYTGDHFGLEKIARQPDIFLVIANHLQNKRLFREALQHVVGQTLQRNEGFDLPDNNLSKIVDKCAHDLVSKLEKVLVSLYMLETLADLPEFVGSSVFQRFLLVRLAAKRVASGEMFATFQYLLRLTSGSELIGEMELKWLVNSAAIIPSGVREAIEFIEEQGDNSDRDWVQNCQPSLDSLYNVEGLNFTPARIYTALKHLVARAQKEIQPLMGRGPDCGYFTCVDFKDTYAWEEAVDVEMP